MVQTAFAMAVISSGPGLSRFCATAEDITIPASVLRNPSPFASAREPSRHHVSGSVGPKKCQIGGGTLKSSEVLLAEMNVKLSVDLKGELLVSRGILGYRQG